MNKRKIIYDLVHSYIEITPEVEEIINHESFQRLKFICQLTTQHLYPSANHTRFEHSLGVMKLAGYAQRKMSSLSTGETGFSLTKNEPLKIWKESRSGAMPTTYPYTIAYKINVNDEKLWR